MSDLASDPIRIEQAAERLRQESETFNQRKEQEARWFNLRLRMGYLAVVLLPAVMTLSSYVLLNHALFPASVLAATAGALFTDALGLVVAVWRLVLNPGSITKLEPVSNQPLLDFDGRSRLAAVRVESREAD